MFKNYVAGTILTVIFNTVTLLPTHAETRVDSVLGTVTKVDALTSSYIRKTPTDERNCGFKDVPIYSQASENNELGSMLLGGLLGSAIGNKLSDNNGAGSAGAVAGALIGRDRAKKNSNSGEIIGYRQQEVCTNRRVVLEEVVDKISGYQIQIEADDRILSFEYPRPLSIGDRIEIRKTVTYTIN